MTWKHYTDAKTLVPESRQQLESKDSLHFIHRKPEGLWVTDDSENNWPSYCRVEAPNFLGANCFDVLTHSDAKFLNIADEQGMIDLNRNYGVSTGIGDDIGIDWYQVALKYQGVFITPYQWKFRLHPAFHWYYVWDCASGCIWDSSAISRVTETNQKEMA